MPLRSWRAKSKLWARRKARESSKSPAEGGEVAAGVGEGEAQLDDVEVLLHQGEVMGGGESGEVVYGNVECEYDARGFRIH